MVVVGLVTLGQINDSWWVRSASLSSANPSESTSTTEATTHWKMQPQRQSQIGTVEINMNQLKEWGWFILDCWGLDHGMIFVGHSICVFLGFAGVCLMGHAVWVLRP